MNIRTFFTPSSVLITNLSKSMIGGKKPVQSVDPDKSGSDKFKPWGDDNLYPQWVMDQLKDTTLIKPVLAFKAEALYGGGLAYGLERVEKGKEILEPLHDTEIEDWCEQSNIQQYLLEAPANFYHFYNFFPGLVQSVDGSRINYLHCHESTDTRWGRRNTKGYVDRAYISPDWAQYGADHKDTHILPVINPYRHSIEDIKTVSNKELIYPIGFPSPGRGYYQEAPWHGLLRSWLPIAKAIPEYKGALLANQLSVRYIIHVPDWYWKSKYKEWDGFTDKEKTKIIDEEHKAFDEFFSGKEKGKSLLVSARDDVQGRKYADWKIENVGNTIDKGAFIEDSQEADAHIFKNLQVNPTLFGNVAGKDLSGGGSGSNARVAWNNYQLLTKPHQMLIMAPLNYVSRYNGWTKRLQKDGTRLRFWFKNYMIARLDEGSETKPSNNSVDE